MTDTRFRISRPFDFEEKQIRQVTLDGIHVGNIVTETYISTETDISIPNFYGFEPSAVGIKLYNLLNRFISNKYWDTVKAASMEVRECLIEEDQKRTTQHS